jgi:hypothetical protein
MTHSEETAYDRLSAKLAEAAAGATVEILGPLKKNDNGFYQEVRDFAIKV